MQLPDQYQPPYNPRQIFYEAPVMYAITRQTEAGPIVADCNQLFLDTLDFARDAVIGRLLADFYTPASRIMLLAGGYQQALTRGLQAAERELVARDGRVIPVLLRATPISGEDGTPIGTCAAFIDITARKAVQVALERERALLARRVEERTGELRQANELQRAILQHAATAIIATSADGIILSFNPAAEQMLGYSVTDMVGHTGPEAFFSPDELHERARQLSSALSEPVEAGFAVIVARARLGLPGDEEWTLLRRDGSHLPVLLSVAVLRDEQGQVSGYVMMASDISARKRMEENLRQSEEYLRGANAEMARVLRLKDEFLASISHELRTPLNAILGLSESMAEGLGGTLNEKQQRYVKTIAENGGHLLRLINDMLDLSRLEAGQVGIDFASASMLAICEADTSQARERALAKRLRFSVARDPHIEQLYTDERRLKQILANLLDNAIKFTPEGGSIGLEVSADSATQVVSFCVWDTGVGIGAENLPRLFQRFTQLDGRLSRQYGGTGLGLALVGRLVRMLGGGVTVTSVPGQGSRFTVNLPWWTAPVHLAPSQHATPAGLREQGYQALTLTEGMVGYRSRPSGQIRPIVLLLEDVEPVIATVSANLAAQDLQVVIARGAAEGLALAAELQPGVIILDTQLPGLDGVEFARRLRAEMGLRHTPIVGVSGILLPHDRERCLASGMNAYLTHPLNLTELAETIRALLPPLRT